MGMLEESYIPEEYIFMQLELLVATRYEHKANVRHYIDSKHVCT